MRIHRRTLLQGATGAVLAGAFPSRFSRAVGPGPSGFVIGEPTADKVGARILADGGNATDAIVAAALTAAIAAPHQTGLGGYGAHGIFAVDGGKRIVSIDANSAAPAAMRPDTFQVGPDGKVPGNVNSIGWMAVGVPGILAGLQLALDRFGTRSFGECAQPAIQLARDGIRWPASLTAILRTNHAQLQRDPGSKKLYFRNGEPITPGSVFQNHELADMLQTLAAANSVEPFYRGAIAQQIADAFQKNGGLLTAQDLASYQAKLVEPLALTCQDRIIHTAPLTAGGLTCLQVLSILQALDWQKMPAGVPRSHARIEAMRLAWRDRLSLVGDPTTAERGTPIPSPSEKLLSAEYANECAARVAAAVKMRKLLDHSVTPREQNGTINLSAADRHGNFAVLTLTHGDSFGAKITVDGIGLTLGHGMSRFDPHPNHPNAPGPGKRPLHNMCPTIVTDRGQAVLGVGGRGGRKIPNAVTELLAQFVLLEKPLAAAMAAPRIHTQGDAAVELEAAWPEEELMAFKEMGYSVKTSGSATLSAVAIEDGQMQVAMR